MVSYKSEAAARSKKRPSFRAQPANSVENTLNNALESDGQVRSRDSYTLGRMLALKLCGALQMSWQMSIRRLYEG
jgi:hypothetical protein